MRARATTLTAAAVLAGLGLVAGCGPGGGSSNDATSASGGTKAAPPVPGAHPRDALGDGTAADEAGTVTQGTSARVLPMGRDIVYRGELTVRVKDVSAAAARAEDLVIGMGGIVFGEESSTDPGRAHASHASLTLRVPPTQFRPLLDRLARLGKPLTRSQTAEDVTGAVVDVRSRVASQRRSVARLQALLDRADTIGAIVQVEGELSRRESDLESLEAQQKKLADITDLATVDVTFVAPDVKVAPPADDKNLGFGNGLRNGLHALGAVVVVGLTGLGAAVPFVVCLVVLGLPAWLLLRGRRRPRDPAPVAVDA